MFAVAGATLLALGLASPASATVFNIPDSAIFGDTIFVKSSGVPFDVTSTSAGWTKKVNGDLIELTGPTDAPLNWTIIADVPLGTAVTFRTIASDISVPFTADVFTVDAAGALTGPTPLSDAFNLNAQWTEEIDVSPPTSDVPEPPSLVLLGAGLLGLTALRRQHRT